MLSLSLSLSLLIIDLSLCFRNCPFKLVFAGDPCLVKSLDLLGLCPHEFEVSLITLWIPAVCVCVCVCVQLINALKTVSLFEVKLVDYKYKCVIQSMLALNVSISLEKVEFGACVIESWCVSVGRCRFWSRSTSLTTLISSSGCMEPDWPTSSFFPTGPSYLSCTWFLYFSAVFMICVDSHTIHCQLFLRLFKTLWIHVNRSHLQCLNNVYNIYEVALWICLY